MNEHPAAASRPNPSRAGTVEDGARPDPRDVLALTPLIRNQLSPSSVVRSREPLAPHTTLRVGGPADLWIEPAGEDDLARVLNLCSECHVPWRILGRGSNLVVRDGGFRGVVVRLSQPAFRTLTPSGSTLRCGAGLPLPRLAAEARRLGLSGFEFFEGIPGSLGGALRMNAGAHGSRTYDRVVSVRCMDRSGRIGERRTETIPVQYRACPLFADHVALGAVFLGEPAPESAIRERMAAFSRRRWASQPRQPSAGCAFKNPGALPAGRLIEELGLKGTRIGGAQVSLLHGNFIVNLGNATAAEVLSLINLIRRRALEERGVALENEVEIIGED